MGYKKSGLTVAILTILCLISFSTEAHALDKRLKLMFKTAGYGAGAGFVLGAGSIAMGMGGVRNILMGTSSGMYAGILLAAYIIATPKEDMGTPTHGPKNPFSPRKPVGPDDYEDYDREDLKDHLPPQRDDDSGAYEGPLPGKSELAWPGMEISRKGLGGAVREVAVWTPLVTLTW